MPETRVPPAVPGVFLDHLDASIAQAVQIASAADQLVVRASLIAIARIARHARPGCTEVTFYEDDNEYLAPGGWVEDNEDADAEAVEEAIKWYAASLWRGNDSLWGPYITEAERENLSQPARYVLDVERALAIPQPGSRLGYTRGEVKYGAGQTPGRDGQPSPTRYFPIDFTEG